MCNWYSLVKNTELVTVHHIAHMLMFAEVRSERRVRGSRVPLSELCRTLEAGIWRWTELYGNDGRSVNVREHLLVTDLFIPARKQEMWLDDTLRLLFCQQRAAAAAAGAHGNGSIHLSHIRLVFRWDNYYQKAEIKNKHQYWSESMTHQKIHLNVSFLLLPPSHFILTSVKEADRFVVCCPCAAEDIAMLLCNKR